MGKDDKTVQQLPANADVSKADSEMNKLKDDIAILKKDAEALVSKRANFEAHKKDLSKEESDALKQEIEAEANRIETRKQELLTTIKQTKGELESLKGTVESSVEKNQLDLLEKEIEAIPGQKKNVFEKARGWAKENPKTAIGVSTVGVGLLIRGLVSLFKKKKKEEADEETDEKPKKNKKEKKEKSSWRKWLLGGGALAAAGYGVYHLLKGDSLSFEDSLVQVEAELGTISEADEMSLRGGKITYEESVKQIKSYGVGTQINKGRWVFGPRIIEGLDIKFSEYKQLIHAANLVNYIKHTYKGRCLDNTPFTSDSFTGDIYINIKKGNNKTEKKEIISGGIGSTLASICPDLLNGLITDTANKDKFLAYLNKQLIWKEGDIVPPDPRGDKIQMTMNEVRQEIVDTPSEFDPLSKERGQIITTPENSNKTEYIIESRGDPAEKTKVKMEADTSGNIISGKIDGLEITFTTTKELLRAANLVNKLKYQYSSVATPLKLEPNEKAFSRKNGVLSLLHPGIYVDNSTPSTIDDRVVKKETLENIFPTILEKKEIFIDYLNELKRPDGKGLRER